MKLINGTQLLFEANRQRNHENRKEEIIGDLFSEGIQTILIDGEHVWIDDLPAENINPEQIYEVFTEYIANNICSKCHYDGGSWEDDVSDCCNAECEHTYHYL